MFKKIFHKRYTLIIRISQWTYDKDYSSVIYVSLTISYLYIASHAVIASLELSVYDAVLLANSFLDLAAVSDSDMLR